jgi:hypothetical protein
MAVRAWIRWYVRLLRQAAQPRDDAAVERLGILRAVFGCRTPGSGWGAILWGSQAAVLALAALAAAPTSLWWAGLVVLPLLAHSVARAVGTTREGHLL